MPWIKTIGIIVGEVIYFTLIYFAWKAMGWKFNDTHSDFFGLITFVVAYIVNPILCAYFVNNVTYNSHKILTVNVCILFFVIVLVCSYANATIFLHASGYERYLMSPGSSNQFGGETLAWLQFINSIELFISGVVFIISYNIIGYNTIVKGN